MDNLGIGLDEVDRLVTGAMTGVASLKDNVTSFWGGPAASSYQDILAQSINFSRMTSLMNEMQDEIVAAMEMLADKQAGDSLV